jgi:signal transduction histidine kinase
MRQVVLYSLVMTVADNVQPILQRETGEVLLVFINFLGSLARAGIFFIVGWIENQLVKVTRSQQDELREANAKLRKYALSAEKLAQTQERNRLARELHDKLAHTLSSSAVQLEAAKSLFKDHPEQAKDMIEKALENTRSGLVETRRALADLRASELESYGLTRAIHNLADSAAERGGFRVTFKMDKNLDMLPEDLTHALYRTAQESFENVLRHAGAKTVVVKLFSEGNRSVFTVKDDGIGFSDIEMGMENYGIRGMRERIEMLGGQLTIDSSPGKGTRVRAELEHRDD